MRGEKRGEKRDEKRGEGHRPADHVGIPLLSDKKPRVDFPELPAAGLTI